MIKLIPLILLLSIPCFADLPPKEYNKIAIFDKTNISKHSILYVSSIIARDTDMLIGDLLDDQTATDWLVRGYMGCTMYKRWGKTCQVYNLENGDVMVYLTRQPPQAVSWEEFKRLKDENALLKERIQEFLNIERYKGCHSETGTKTVR